MEHLTSDQPSGLRRTSTAPALPGMPSSPKMLLSAKGNYAGSKSFIESPWNVRGDYHPPKTTSLTPDSFAQLASEFDTLKQHEEQLWEKREILFRSEALLLKRRETWIKKMQSIVSGSIPSEPQCTAPPILFKVARPCDLRHKLLRICTHESCFDTPPDSDAEDQGRTEHQPNTLTKRKHQVKKLAKSSSALKSGSYGLARRPSQSSLFSYSSPSSAKDKTKGGPSSNALMSHKAKLLQLRRARTKSLITGGRTGKVTFREQIWLALEDPHLNRCAFYVHTVYAVIILLSVCSTIIQTLDEPGNEIRRAVSIIEICFNATFTLEVLIRFLCTPSFWALAKSMYYAIDVMSVIPFYIRVCSGLGPQDNLIIELISCLIPILRLLKVTRHSSGWRLLVISMQRCVSPLKVPFFFLALITVFSSAIIFWVEKHSACHGDDCLPTEIAAFISLPETMWFALVTISTVGYGDVHPNTAAGKFCSSILILVGVCYLSMPLAIVGTSFVSVWEDRGVILLREKTKERLAHQNVSKKDVKAVFEMADENGNGSVSLDEFMELLELFNLGISRADICRLFRSIDTDLSGSITLEEFTVFMFPEVYGSEVEDDLAMGAVSSVETLLERDKYSSASLR